MLGAPKPSETFEELFSWSCTIEHHDQQCNAGRAEAKSAKQFPKKDSTTPESVVPKSKGSKALEEPLPKEPSPKVTTGRSLVIRRGCFHCLEHVQWNCPKLKAEASGWSGRVSALTGETSTGSMCNMPAFEEDTTVQENSIQQLEQVLANMRFPMEQSRFKKSRVETVMADSVEAVGAVILQDIKIGGHPWRRWSNQELSPQSFQETFYIR